MAPVENRLTISLTGSTSSIGIGGRSTGLQLEQAAQRGELAGLVVDPARVLLEDVVALGAGGVLQLEHRLGVEQVVLALASPLVLAADLEVAVGALLGPGEVGEAVAPATSSASSSRPTPPRRLAVPVKYSSTSSWARPMASKIWAPV